MLGLVVQKVLSALCPPVQSSSSMVEFCLLLVLCQQGLQVTVQHMPCSFIPAAFSVVLLQGTLPAGVDQRYLAGFLAREIDRAAQHARDTSSSSSSRAAAPSGAALLQAVLVRYGQLLNAAHLALAGHRLAELQQEGLAGNQQVSSTSCLLLVMQFDLD
jgi:hypothetical protein